MSGRIPEYDIWAAMISRCENVRNRDYVNYGGRGIHVCLRWRVSFDDFIDDVGHRPRGMSLDRINNDGNYEPGNVRWATRTEQNENRRSVIWLEHTGKRLTLAGWARELGIARGTMSRRYRAGYPVDELFFSGHLLVESNARRPKGSSFSSAKLTVETVQMIRMRRKDGVSYRALATEFGVSKSLVEAVLRGWRWAHVQ